MSNATKQVIFRYNKDDHPMLDEWLNNQSNRTQSIIYTLESIIIQSGVDTDVVKHALSKSLNSTDKDGLEPVGDDEWVSDEYKSYKVI